MLSVPPRNVHPLSNQPVGQEISFLNHLAQGRFFRGKCVESTSVLPWWCRRSRGMMLNSTNILDHSTDINHHPPLELRNCLRSRRAMFL
ncbi:hypothetical protein JAAARDRAFT_36636 [Jaapia argillacea MUCL 33604]|uniref:Uncharacterized protein n=1 Tax=Jaapia argillacea MUCL 33604 TaxID=933084 RepID=A0A067PNY3_9AGAM|nr:hypothetical protein JAAARDRAFT_36636 [Jaapia argillacea MUCL 33604]